MNFRSIRVRLTLWYLLVLATGLGVFGVGTWIAIRESVAHTIDQELADRVQRLRTFMEGQGAGLRREGIREEFRERSALGPERDLFQVCDGEGRWLYRSAVLESNQAPISRPEELREGRRYETRELQGAPLRFLSERVEVEGSGYTVQVAESMNEFREALDRFRAILLLSAPVLLALASVGGYWLSRRALDPVDRVIAAADTIRIQNLSERLDVPRTGDEIERLSETLNRMLERLHGSVERISQFTADASHELRAPVSLIRTTAELAVKGDRTNAEYREDMAQILAEAERTTRLIESLLLLARADAGTDGLLREMTDVGRAVTDAAGQSRALAGEKGIELRVEGLERPVVVNGDDEALRRLFFILIDNAVKYTGAGGQVTVRLAVQQGHAVVEVIDTGIGIAAEDQERIFDRFWRADKVRSRGMGGAGLGLSIARWIVERHDGVIEVQSEVGKGSLFRVRLPLEEEGRAV